MSDDDVGDDDIDAWLDSDASEDACETSARVERVAEDPGAVTEAMKTETMDADADAHSPAETRVGGETGRARAESVVDDAPVVMERVEAVETARMERVEAAREGGDVGRLAADVRRWASIGLSKAREVAREVSSSEAARALRRDLREFGSHVVGDDGARTRLLDERAAGEDGSDGEDADANGSRGGRRDDAPSAADAMRLAESFASGAWAALGGAANKARAALEKADVDARARSMGFGALGAGMGALGALTNVVRATADVLTGDDDDDEHAARAVLTERLTDFGADELRSKIESEWDAASERLLRNASQGEFERARERVRQLEEAMMSEASAPPASPGGAATLVAVPLDDHDGGDARAPPQDSLNTLASLIGVLDSRADEISASLTRLANKSDVREEAAQFRILDAFEDAANELRDEIVCDGLAKLTMSALRAIEDVVESIHDGRLIVGDDAFRAAAVARARVSERDEDVRVFIQASKEAVFSIAAALCDATRDEPSIGPQVNALTQSAVALLDRDQNTCLTVARDVSRAIPWVIVAKAHD